MACRAVCCRKPKPAGLPVVFSAGGFQRQQTIQLDGLPDGFDLESLPAPEAQPSNAGVILELSKITFSFYKLYHSSELQMEESK